MNSQCSRRYFITVLQSEATLKLRNLYHDDGIKWEHFPRYCPFVMGIHRSLVDSSHKDQWRGVLCFLWSAPKQTVEHANNQDVGDLKRHRAHYCVTIMWIQMVINPHRNTCSLYDFRPIPKISSKFIITLRVWPGDAISCHRSWSELVQVMASCLTAPSHCLKQYWLTIKMVLWFSFHDNVYFNTQYTNT